MIKIADLKFKVLADLSQLKRDISKVLKTKLNLGGGGERESKGEKKQSSLLAGILKGIAPVAILASLKPIADTLSVLKGFIIFGIIELIKRVTAIPDAIKTVFEGLGKIFSGEMDLREFLTSLISNPITSFSAWLALFVIGTISDFGKWLAGFIPKPLADFGKWLAKFIFKKVLDFGSWLSQFIPQPIKDFGKWLAGFIINPIVDFGKWLKQFLGFGGGDSGTGMSKQEQERGMNYAQKLYAGLNPSPYPKKINDAIITKKGQIIETNPNDTIIATQNPNSMGGGATINLYGVTPERLINEIERRLAVNSRRASRF